MSMFLQVAWPLSEMITKHREKTLDTFRESLALTREVLGLESVNPAGHCEQVAAWFEWQGDFLGWRICDVIQGLHGIAFSAVIIAIPSSMSPSSSSSSIVANQGNVLNCYSQNHPQTVGLWHWFYLGLPLFCILIQTLEIEHGWVWYSNLLPMVLHCFTIWIPWYRVVSTSKTSRGPSWAAAPQPAQAGGKESELRNLVQEPQRCRKNAEKPHMWG